MSLFENELLIYFRQIVDDILQEVIIRQAKAMGEFDLQKIVCKFTPVIAVTLEWEDEIIESLRNRSKRDK